MDGKKVREHLIFLYGDRWRRDAPRSLRTTISTIDRWIAKSNTPGPAQVAILLLVQRRITNDKRRNINRTMKQREREREGTSNVR